MTVSNSLSRFLLFALLSLLALSLLLGLVVGMTGAWPGSDGDSRAPADGRFDNSFDGQKVDPIGPIPVVSNEHSSTTI